MIADYLFCNVKPHALYNIYIESCLTFISSMLSCSLSNLVHLKINISNALLVGRSWAATTTEGLLIYSLDSGLVFDPFDLDIDITPSNVRKVLRQKEYTKAIVMTFRLNEKKLIQEVLETVPYNESKQGSCFNVLPVIFHDCRRVDFLEF